MGWQKTANWLHLFESDTKFSKGGVTKETSWCLLFVLQNLLVSLLCFNKNYADLMLNANQENAIANEHQRVRRICSGVQQCTHIRSSIPPSIWDDALKEISGMYEKMARMGHRWAFPRIWQPEVTMTEL